MWLSFLQYSDIRSNRSTARVFLAYAVGNLRDFRTRPWGADALNLHVVLANIGFRYIANHLRRSRTASHPPFSLRNQAAVACRGRGASPRYHPRWSPQSERPKTRLYFNAWKNSLTPVLSLFTQYFVSLCVALCRFVVWTMFEHVWTIFERSLNDYSYSNLIQ